MDTSRNAAVLRVVMLVLAGALVLRLVQLQVIQYPHYRELSDRNAAHTIRLHAPRGVIYDRAGRVLVSNRTVFALYFHPFQVADKPGALRQLAAVSGISFAELQKSAKKSGYRSFDPILLKDDLSLEEVIRIQERRYKIPGITVEARPVRYYPHSGLAAHVIGTVGAIDSDEVEALEGKGYRAGDMIGKSGIERSYDDKIRGVDGGEVVEVDARGRPGRVLEVRAPVPGNDITLTIDVGLQMQVEKSLGGKRGGVVVMDPRNGDILAMASRPHFDPLLFTSPEMRKQLKSMSSAGFPFVNRAISGFPPGSTFKAVTMLAALETGVVTTRESFSCPGYYTLGARIARCWKLTGHGRLDLSGGLINSCDIVFYEMGRRLGPDKLAFYSRLMGLGKKTGVPLSGEAAGHVPDTEWKKRALGEEWYTGESINYGIGQGYLLVTPIQLAQVYSTIARAGTRMQPKLLREIVNRSGEILYTEKPVVDGVVDLKPENYRLVHEALVNVVARATGRRASLPDFPAAGKTGTAEVPNGAPHAWFVCYAPVQNPEIVIASFVEHGEHGDQVTAQIAREVLTWYRDNRKVKPAPSTEEPSAQIF